MSDNLEFSVLIADCDSQNVSDLRQILENKYSLLTAESGEKALAILREEKPDIILLNVKMPDMSGFDALAELKRSDSTSDIPVILVTESDSVGDEEKGFALGAADFITKPFHAPIVKARVSTHLEMVRQVRIIEQNGLIDIITDIPNRRGFDTQIDIEWARAVREKTSLCLLKVCVDRFEDCVGTYGHQQGVAILQTVSKLLVSTLKRKTDMAFRWGGEEFMVILLDTTLGGAIRVAETIRAGVEDKVADACGGNPPTVTVSIGIASSSPKADGQITDFITAADKALNSARDNGKNMVCSYTVI